MFNLDSKKIPIYGRFDSTPQPGANHYTEMSKKLTIVFINAEKEPLLERIAKLEADLVIAKTIKIKKKTINFFK